LVIRRRSPAIPELEVLYQSQRIAFHIFSIYMGPAWQSTQHVHPPSLQFIQLVRVSGTENAKWRLPGGVNIILSPANSIAFTKAGVLAPDGRCKTFDALANGYVRGEGGGVIVLKALSSALADGDHVHAVILGSAMQQDGRTNGLMAPSSEGQETMLRAAYKSAGISPADVQYIETHGTGTLLGDSMEAKALGAVIGVDKLNRPLCDRISKNKHRSPGSSCRNCRFD
jgi:hypothetical protein